MQAKFSVLVVLLIVCLAGQTIFAGGTVQSSGTAPAAAAGPVKVTYPITTAGAKSLSFWLPIQPPAARHMSSYKDQEVYAAIEKNTGIDITYIHPAIGQEREQLGVLMASGDIPDILQIRGLYPGGSSVGVEEGVFRDLTNLIFTHAPDYLREVSKTDYNYRIATTNEGKFTEFMLIKQRAPVFDRLNYRQDFMDKLGIDVPITIKDYDDDFAAMKTAGIIGFAPPMNGKIDQLMYPYGLTSGFFIGTDNKIKWGEIEPGYKQYLEMMAGWYAKGYISPDFMSNMNDVDRRALFTTGRVGMINQPVDLVNSSCAAVGIKSVPLPYPRLTPGQQINFMPVSFETRPLTEEPFATVISTSCKNPEVATEYLNYLYTPDGADLANWGIKDKAWKVDANGNKYFTDYMLNNPTIPLADVQVVLKIHQIAKLSEPDVVCNPNVIVNKEALAQRMMYSDDPTINDSQVMPAFTLGLKESARRNEIMRDINTYSDEMTLKFITGVSPISDFDSYVAQVKRMGIDEAIQITQDGYQTFLTKPGRP
ncbi:MAG: extracellular solute-binding protein [Treponema sp.]|nr:extracellular solute-binding protein [Treponema sp.]